MSNREAFETWRNGEFKGEFEKLVFIGFAPNFQQAASFANSGWQAAEQHYKADIDKAVELLTWFVTAPGLHIREAQATRGLPAAINQNNKFVQAETLIKAYKELS